MFRKVLIPMLVILITTHGYAGLDNEGGEGHIVAIYSMENGIDSGPRMLNVETDGSFVNRGKVGKCLELNGQEKFFMGTSRWKLFVIGDFSIVAWVKLQKQRSKFILRLGGLSDDDDLYAVSLEIKPDGNLKGLFLGDEEDERVSIDSEGINVADNKWHHIAYTSYGLKRRLFLDGSIVTESGQRYMGFRTPETFVYISSVFGESITGNVLIDEVGFFEIGLSAYDLKGLMKDGFDKFLETMPVDPQGKVATTWAAIKQRR